MAHFVSGLKATSTTLVIFKMVHVQVPLWYETSMMKKSVLYNILYSECIIRNIVVLVENFSMKYRIQLFISIDKWLAEEVWFGQKL